MNKHYLLLAFLISIHAGAYNMSAQVIAIEIDTVAVHTGMVGNADLTGYTTYRFYAVMQNAESKLLDIYGITETPLFFGSTGDVWNHNYNQNIHKPSSQQLIATPALAYDTWMDISDENDAFTSDFTMIGYDTPNDPLEHLLQFPTPASNAIAILMSVLGEAIFNGVPTSSDSELRIEFAQMTTNGSPLYQFNFHTSLNDCLGNVESQTLSIIEGDIGCNNPAACNYDSTIIDPTYNTCVYPACSDPEAINFSWYPPCVGECIYVGPCSNPIACNYDASAIYTDYSTCEYPGCPDPDALNYVLSPPCVGDCIYVGPCSDIQACNYDASAIYTDYSTCEYPGCMDPNGLNYNPDVMCEGVCLYPCPSSNACNYDPQWVVANYESCQYPACLDPNASNYNAPALCGGGVCYYLCTDPNACNYLNNATACQYSTTTFITYYDIDDDEVLTDNDPEIHYSHLILFPDLNNYAWSTSGNNVPIQITPPVDVVFLSDPVWEIVGPNEFTITNGCSIQDLLVTPIGDLWEQNFWDSWITTSGSQNTIGATFNHWLPQTVDYNCTLTFDPLLPLYHPETNEIVSSDTFEFSRVGEFDQSVYSTFHFTPATPDLLGTTIERNLSCVATDELGVELFSFDQSFSQVVVGPYDPNIKVDEPAGWYEPEFIAPSADLSYTIYFQNTGNAAAQNVVVVDSLDLNSYDLSSIEILNTSDSMSYLLDYSTGVITFEFANINLPDSTSNPEGSIGFLEYRIDPLDDLQHLHEIHNTAYIYFDNNPPIITPTTLQTIFDCAVLERETIYLSMCPGDPATVDAFADYIEAVEWRYNDEIISTTNILVFDSLASGEHTLEYTFSNPGCSVTNEIVVSVGPALIVAPWSTPEGWYTGFDGLYHTWFFQGEEIIGNNTALFDDEFEDIAHFGLGVIVTDEFGCNHSYFEYFITVIENEYFITALYPNPASESLIIEHNGQLSTTQPIELVNVFGQKLECKTIVQSNNRLQLDLTNVPFGAYVVTINGKPIHDYPLIKQ